MKHRILFSGLLAASLLAVTGPALAEKPDWAGNGGGGGKGKHSKQEGREDQRSDRRDDYRRDERRDDRRESSTRVEFRFSDDSRRALADYYGAQARAGKCPPGLAKKNNGCMPPGQAKKWRRGYPLPGDVRYHDLPRDILIRLPAPPSNHRYVQVAGDILLIAVGSSMVIDAVEDLMR